jgi:ABC-type multidrug transport system fused ATPase/permease subunit
VSEARLRRISLRLSAYADQVGRERLVEVRLSRLSYHVPVKADAPSVATVWNATPLYKAYRFFRRVHLYRLSRHDTTLTSRTKFIPRKPSDIFLPYRRKKILNDINLVLKPGNSYLILGPPGCGM